MRVKYFLIVTATVATIFVAVYTASWMRENDVEVPTTAISDGGPK